MFSGNVLDTLLCFNLSHLYHAIKLNGITSDHWLDLCSFSCYIFLPTLSTVGQSLAPVQFKSWYLTTIE